MGRARLGEERKRRREEAERAEAARKLYEKVRKEKQEKKAAADLQRLYRGHLGRKAARRWAMKNAELEAMNALMNASAITMQRVFRGYVGKLKASVVRAEMADFIAMIRMEEVHTHTRARLPRTLALVRVHLHARARTNARKHAHTRTRVHTQAAADEEEYWRTHFFARQKRWIGGLLETWRYSAQRNETDQIQYQSQLQSMGEG